MKLLYTVTLVLMSVVANGQLYIGGRLQGGISSSTNSGLQAGTVFAVRSYRDAVTMGAMYSGHVAVQYRYKSAWMEGGFGVFTVTESHKISAPNIFGDYKNINLPFHYWFVPVKLGAVLAQKHGWEISPYIGVNFLVEPTSLGGKQPLAYNEAVALDTRKGSEYSGTYVMYQNGFESTAAIFCAGLRGSRQISRHSSLQFGAEINLGFRVLQSNAIFAVEDRGPGVDLSNFASTKGDGVNLSIGYQYRLSK